MIEHQERREVAQFRGTNASSDSCAGPFALFDSQEGFLDGSWSRHIACVNAVAGGDTWQSLERKTCGFGGGASENVLVKIRYYWFCEFIENGRD